MAVNVSNGYKWLSMKQGCWQVRPGCMRFRRRRSGNSRDGDKGGGGSRWINIQETVGEDAAQRQTAPTGLCLLCLRWTIVSVPINLLAPCARAGKGGRIQNDRHGPVTLEVRSGFNKGLGAMGTLAVWLNKRGLHVRVCLCVKTAEGGLSSWPEGGGVCQL